VLVLTRLQGAGDIRDNRWGDLHAVVGLDVVLDHRPRDAHALLAAHDSLLREVKSVSERCAFNDSVTQGNQP